jgi:hypothetical protein
MNEQYEVVASVQAAQALGIARAVMVYPAK